MRAIISILPSARLTSRAGTWRCTGTRPWRDQPPPIRRAQRCWFVAEPARLAAQRASRSGAGKGEKLPFKEDDIPPLEFWQKTVPRSVLGRLAPEDCHSLTRAYCDLAMAQQPAWKNKLEGEYNMSPEILHHLATILISGIPSPIWALGLHILATASELGYSPSTILLIRLMLKGENPDRLAQTALFRSAVETFLAMVRREENPDALTLQGMILSNQDDDKTALRYFDLAIRSGTLRSDQVASGGSDGIRAGGREGAAGNDGTRSEIRPPRWSMEPACHVGRGEILLRQGRRGEAESAMRIAAMELDDPSGYLGLATALPEDAPERTQYLQIAAVSGKTEACRLLGDVELGLAKGPGLRTREAREHSLWAGEWFTLADDPSKAAEARWAYAK